MINTVELGANGARVVHLFFEWLALASGMQLYRLQTKRSGAVGPLQAGGFGVAIGCVLGAAIGNKLAFWIEYPHLWSTMYLDISTWMSGQSIVGGLLGGLIGVEIAKLASEVKHSTGDNFVLPLIVGTVVGRIGCFIAGLSDGTYGSATTVPWAVDFGDGIGRHPTQIYDIVFVLVWGAGLFLQRERFVSKPGLLFKFYLAGYLFWRLGIDAIKPIPYAYFKNFSGIQVLCAAAIVCYFPFIVRQLLSKN